jgi:hypothetical protein
MLTNVSLLCDSRIGFVDCRNNIPRSFSSPIHRPSLSRTNNGRPIKKGIVSDDPFFNSLASASRLATTLSASHDLRTALAPGVACLWATDPSIHPSEQPRIDFFSFCLFNFPLPASPMYLAA